MADKISNQDRFQKIIKIEQELGNIQDVDVLLERILTEARTIVNADAGSIYVVEGNKIRIKYGQNETRRKLLEPGQKLPYINFDFEINEKTICGYVASTGITLNIKDAYEIPEDKPYKFGKSTDQITNYRTTSIYTLPLKMARGKFLGRLQIINKMDENGNVTFFNEEDELLISHFASSAVQALQHANLTSAMVRRTLKMAEFRDPKETYLHVERVSSYAIELYDRWAFNHKIPQEELHRYRDALKIAAKFHDVGKVGISDIILKKAARFTDEERNIMKTHTYIGAQLFDAKESFLDAMSQEIALHHHDWWNGDEKGYPGDINLDDFSILEGTMPEFKPLAGEKIPLSARIVAVADVFDALCSNRCYKEAWTIEDSVKEIKNGSGTQFDPEIVETFLQVKDRICAIQEALKD